METEGVTNLLGDPKKAILKISTPLIVAMLIQTLYNLVDTIWVAGLGDSALAAVGVFFPFFFILMAVSNGVGVGASSAISRRIGQNNREKASVIAEQSIILSFVIGILVMVTIPFLKAMFIGLGFEEDVANLAYDYGSIMIIGSVILFFTNMGSAILRGEGNTKKPMYAIVVGSIINIILDPIFIYVLGWGIKGAAIATVISMLITALLFAYWIFISKNNYVNMKFSKDRIIPEYSVYTEIFKVGIPASLAQISMSLSMFAMNYIIAIVGGTAGIAIYSTGWRIVSLGVIPLHAIAAGVVAVAGAAYGACNPEKIEEAYKYAIKFAVVCETVVAVVILLLTPQIAYLFTYSEGSAHLYDGIVSFMKYMFLFYPVVPLGMLTSAMFQGINKARYSLILTIFRAIVMQLVAAYIFAFVLGYGLEGIWMGIIAGNGISVIIMYLIGIRVINKLKNTLTKKNVEF
ncbi:MATE family efflux transporter [Methanococcus voltae]|uniref:MATE family efflux protein n=2 Tax=Methanococcus voltae TaxID=2188 RepID=A0ABT2EZM2_METVO|nr:MATE family efflux transporter [Methanococcus voltae]MBP2172823.1 putative MATE family efflux protein [Methanococcus voltae]MBP2201767.1 putative MATE family efflux protein [Methanococcus voltae]MCS3922555.1 putative MATE family efflux protein [Methanococcus voltae PS]